jgi:hypothetical protein
MASTSAAFEDDRDGDPMSVYRREVIEGEGGSILRVLTGHDGYWLASLTAAQLRFREQSIFPDPVPQEISHAKVCGGKSKSARNWFAKQAEWVVGPPPRHPQ